MKLLHTSDLHIGSPLTARLSAIKATERNRELIESFRRSVEAARQSGCEGYIIAGDLFDSEKVGVRNLKLVISIIREASDITFFYLPGNHERDRLSRESSLPENLKIFSDKWTKFTLSDVCIIGRSELSPDMFSTLETEACKKNILVLHGDLTDKTEEGTIGIRELKETDACYIALGHYHSYSKTEIRDGVYAVYSGTPEGRGFDEAGEKGYVIIDTDGESVTHSFVKCAYRTLHTVELMLDEITDDSQLYSAARDALSDIPSRDLVRLVFTGRAIPELVRDTESVRQRFADNFYFLEVKDEARLNIIPEAYAYDRSLKGEFIRLVLASDELSEKEKDDVIRCGLSALMGEE